MLKKDIDALPDYVKLAISRTCRMSDPEGMERRLAAAVRYQKWLENRVLPDKPVLQAVK
jgi:hypothetical protein